jgi:hypothetical protein
MMPPDQAKRTDARAACYQDTRMRMRPAFLRTRAPHGIDIRHIRYVLLVTDLHDFANAATFAQPPHSDVDQKFGAILFARSTRGELPTEAAKFSYGLPGVCSMRLKDFTKRHAPSATGVRARLDNVHHLDNGGNLRSSLFAFSKSAPTSKVSVVVCPPCGNA